MCYPDPQKTSNTNASFSGSGDSLPRIHQRIFVRHEFVHQALENLPAVHFQRDATDAELVLCVVHQVVRPNGSTHMPPSPNHTGRSIGRDRKVLDDPPVSIQPRPGQAYSFTPWTTGDMSSVSKCWK